MEIIYLLLAKLILKKEQINNNIGLDGNDNFFLENFLSECKSILITFNA